MLRIPAVVLVFLLLTPVLIAAIWLLERARLRGGAQLTVAYYRLLRRLLRVRVNVQGQATRQQPALIVANHASWLDIVVISSLAPVAFIAKREVASWPLIGQAARAQGSIFVDRSKRQQTAAVGAEIARRLREGTSVVLFAEGTSSDGNRVLPFRSALLGAVGDVAAKADGRTFTVQPLSICYTRFQGLPLGRQHRPLVAWYGDLDFIPHLKEFICRGAVDAVVTWGPPVAYDNAADRKVLVRSLEQTIRGLTAEMLRRQ
ncbi:MAG TPA: lysophospholipid acyltransferase family protein [Xanthobacteraceae bacterium]|nr:lysophospholipid acyltransferase family protein [Xanthobacteraceae bacterium]